MSFYSFFVEFAPYLHIFFVCHIFSFILKLVDSIYHPFKFICDTEIKRNKKVRSVDGGGGGETFFLARLL